jgi:hypothetical protein
MIINRRIVLLNLEAKENAMLEDTIYTAQVAFARGEPFNISLTKEEYEWMKKQVRSVDTYLELTILSKPRPSTHEEAT